MTNIIVSINAGTVEYGSLYGIERVLEFKNESDLEIQAVVNSIIKFSLCTPSNLTIVIVEPPLMNIHIKTRICQLMLKQYKVRGISILPRSVCSVVGQGKSAGMVQHEEFIIPVYDYRELTPNIKQRGEFDDQELMKQIRENLAIDLRKPLSDVVHCNSDSVWRGVAAIIQRCVLPVYLKYDNSICDSLYC